MAASKNKFFKQDRPQEQVEKKSLEDLKDQLSGIQSKIADIEGLEQERQFEVKDLYKWSSPSHVFVPRGKRWITYIILISLLIILVILFAQQFIIIAPVLAVAFLAYVLASIPPENIDHRFTNQGVVTGKRNFLWEELYDFWFVEKHGQTILNVDTNLNFPARILMIVDKKHKEKVKSILLEYLPYREIPRTNWIDRVGDSLSGYFHKLSE